MTGHIVGIETQKEFSEDEWIPFILREPDTFAGSVVREPKVEITFDRKEQVMQRSVLDASQAVKHLFVETLSNALDSIQRAREANLPVGFLHVDLEVEGPGIISITNSSADIMPIRRNERGVWIPQSLLGSLLSSSNYKAKGKTWAGKNGMGGSLANIFSDLFVVEVWDHVRKLYYRQRWRDNMTLEGDAEVRELPAEEGPPAFPDGCGMVKVTYRLQLERFGYEDTDSYPEDLMEYYIRKVMEGSFICHGLPCRVRYGNFEKVFAVDGVEAYSRLFLEEPATDGRKMVYVHRGKHEVEAVVYDTPDAGYQVSFVNGQMTNQGGVHVDEILKPLVQKCNAILTETEKEEAKLTVNDLLLHITVFISVRVPDPKFTSQTKERLSSPRPASIHWHEGLLEELREWEMVGAIREALLAKKRRVLSKTDGKKSKFVNIPNAEDANKAGGPESHLCRLVVCEGNSAKNYALEALDYRQGGRDYLGIYPLSGKIINVANATMEQIVNNKQITELKAMLGLVSDADLADDFHYHRLRYGAVEIMTDADGDGSHIRGLLMLFLALDFPGFLFRECLQTWMTPLVRAVRTRNQTLSFYTLKDFGDWKRQMAETNEDLKKWKIKYYKGLGSSDTAEIKEDCLQNTVLVQAMEEGDRERLFNAFDKGRVSFRKEQVYRRVQHGDQRGPINLKRQSIQQFIDTDWLDYTLLSINRAIPNLMDGLKVSERKALWYGLKYLKGEMKTSQVANDTANKMDYPHNEDILTKTISNMTQDFPGSNNLAYFQGRGKFGSMYRHEASAGRYTYVAPNWWLRLVFRPEDDDIMPMMSEEGKECEPEFLLPILPMVLVNGCLGIATSVSTFVPAYNPMDLVQEIRRKLTMDSETRVLLVPYYRGFKGTVELLVDRKKEHSEKLSNYRSEMERERSNTNADRETIAETHHDDDDRGNDHPSTETVDPESTAAVGKKKEPPIVMMSNRIRGPQKTVFDARTYEGTLPGHINAIQFCGCYRELPGKMVRVTELPIGFAGEDYKRLLDSWRERKLIKDYDNHSKVNSMDFTIRGIEDVTYQSLSLIRRMGITNQNLLTPVGGFPGDCQTAQLKGDENDRYLPERYEDVYSILDTFVQCRLHYYQIRKNNKVNRLRGELKRLQLKLQFIQLVLGGTLPIHGTNIEVVEASMKMHELPIDLLDHTPIKAFTQNEVDRLQSRIDVLGLEFNEYASLTPSQIWLQDLDEFEKVYGKHHKGAEGSKFVIREDEGLPNSPDEMMFAMEE